MELKLTNIQEKLQEKYQKILFFREFKDNFFPQEFADFPGVLANLHQLNFIVGSASNLL